MMVQACHSLVDFLDNYIKPRGCNRMRFYRILVAALLKYKKYQEN